MKVDFLNLSRSIEEIRTPLIEGISDVVLGGDYILGSNLTSFEKDFANFVGSSHCVGVANGLDALVLSLKVLNIGPGDEVIVPSHTFIATWLAVSAVGATIVPVEPDLENYVIRYEDVVKKVTSKTKAIIVVHLYGYPVDMLPFDQLKSKGIFLIEDAAQAHGASVSGRRIGSSGNLVCWSFYPGKNLGALGDAGGITTDDESFAELLRSLRNYGSRMKYVHDNLGYNSRMDELQAKVLSIKLKYLAEWNFRRAIIAKIYMESLIDLPIFLPKYSMNCDTVWHLFVIRSVDRDQLKSFLDESGITTLIHYPIPPSRQLAYLGFNNLHLPVAEEISRTCLSLPIGPHVLIEEAKYVVKKIYEFYSR